MACIEAQSAILKETKGDSCAPSFAREVSETARRGEHNESNIDVAKNGELVSLFNEPISTFGEGDLPIGIVFYSLNRELNTTHFKQVLDLPLLNKAKGNCRNLQKPIFRGKQKKYMRTEREMAREEGTRDATEGEKYKESDFVRSL